MTRKQFPATSRSPIPTTDTGVGPHDRAAASPATGGALAALALGGVTRKVGALRDAVGGAVHKPGRRRNAEGHEAAASACARRRRRCGRGAATRGGWRARLSRRHGILLDYGCWRWEARRRGNLNDRWGRRWQRRGDLETAATAVVAKKTKKQGKKIPRHCSSFSPFACCFPCRSCSIPASSQACSS